MQWIPTFVGMTRLHLISHEVQPDARKQQRPVGMACTLHLL